jgi:hypothetical protein
LSGAGSEDIRQGIIDLVRQTKTDNTAILIHGVSLSLRGSGRLDTRLDTPPISYRHHPVSRLAPRDGASIATDADGLATYGDEDTLNKLLQHQGTISDLDALARELGIGLPKLTS